MTSRSALMPRPAAVFASAMTGEPAPPVSQTIGSGAGGGDVGFNVAARRRSVRPPGLLRFSGTLRYPHVNFGPRSNWGDPGNAGLGHRDDAYDADVVAVMVVPVVPAIVGAPTTLSDAQLAEMRTNASSRATPSP